MAKYDDDVCKRLLDIANRHNDCLNDYDKIITVCPKRLLSRGVDLYGLYWPDMEMSKYIISKSKPTRNEKRKHYAYYFDEQDRLRLTERYDDHKDDLDDLLNLIFFYYYENHTEIVWYSQDQKAVSITGFMDYENGKLTRFVESYNFVTALKHGKGIESYHEYRFDIDPVNVRHRIYATNMNSDGSVWERVSEIKKR